VARANVLALQSDYCGVLNIATGVPETLRHLITYIEKAGGKPAEMVEMNARAGDILHSFGMTQKAKKYLNFQSSLSLEEGIKSLLA
jgi:nucleoside-diphosphate-sugar epimerase